MKWACSVITSRFYKVDNVQEKRHWVFLVEAINRYEAVGKASLLARKGYPPAQGWDGHHTVVCPETDVIDPKQDVRLVDSDSLTD